MSKYGFLDGLEDGGETWLVAIDGSVKRSLVRELSSRSRIGAGVRVMTLDEAVERFSHQTADGPGLLTRGEPVVLTAWLLNRYSAELEYFNRFSGAQAVEGVSGPVAQALRRLAESGHETGNPGGRLADLGRLLAHRRERLHELGYEEGFELHRRLARLVTDGKIPLPRCIVLIYPTHPSPSEMDLVEALFGACDLRIVVESEFTEAGSDRPSTRHLFRFNEQLNRRGIRVRVEEDGFGDRDRLVHWLFDGAERPDPPPGNVHPWRALDRRDEVVRVLREIKRRAVDGGGGTKEVDLSRYMIVLPRLEPYVSLLASEMTSRGIPFSLPAGEPLAATAASQVIFSLLDCLRRPGRAELFAYWSHPAVTPPGLLKREGVRRELAELAQYLPPAPTGENPVDFWTGEGVSGRMHPGGFDRLARDARVTGLPRGWETRLDVNERLSQAWARPVLNHLRTRVAGRLHRNDGLFEDEKAVGGIRRRLFELATVLHELRHLEGLRNPELEVSELIEKVRRELEERAFYRNICARALEHLRASTGEGEVGPAEAVVQRRRIEAVMQALKEVREALGAVEGVARFSREKLNQPLRGAGAFRRHFEAEVAARSVRVPGPDRGLAVYELDKTNGLAFGEVFVLGLTNEDFPGRREFSLLPEACRTDEPDPRDRAVYMLGRILRRADAVWLSYPRHTLGGEARPAPPLQDLYGLLGESPPEHDPITRPTSLEELAVADPGHALPGPGRSSSIGAARMMLEGRLKEEPTAYDGLVDRELCRELPSRERKNEFSVTQFEDFLNCPRRFFFAHLMGLRSLPEVRDEVENNVVGIVTHRALEYFFAGRGEKEGVGRLEAWDLGELTNANWAAACERMLDCAAWAFVDSGLVGRDAKPSPPEQIRCGFTGASAALDAQRVELVEGLDDPEAGGPYGVLKGALIIQRYAIRTLPTRVEYGFGRGQEAPALRLDGLSFSGRVDRVDYDAEGGRLSVFDYKTGSDYPKPVDVRKQRTIQLALYALAAKQNITGNEPTEIRGSIVALNHRNLDPESDEFGELKNGVLVEHVALGDPRNKVVSFDRSEGRLEEAKRLGLMKLEEMTEGRFLPTSESDRFCRRCDFNGICGEDFHARRIALAVREGGDANEQG